MYLLKISVLAITALLSTMAESNWKQINDTQLNVSFKLPDYEYNRVEADSAFMFTSHTIDTVVTAQVVVYPELLLSSSEFIQEYMTTTGETDTLNVIAQHFLTSTDGELVYLQKQVNSPTNKVMDIGVRYSVTQEDGSSTYVITYTRFCFQKRKSVVMSVTAHELNLNTLVETRNQIWNSLVIN